MRSGTERSRATQLTRSCGSLHDSATRARRRARSRRLVFESTGAQSGAFPQLTRYRDGLDAKSPPTRRLIADTMHLAVMDMTERDRDSSLTLRAQRPRLHEAKEMRIRMLAPAHQARLLGYEAQMLLITIAARFGDGKDALVNARGSGILQAQGLTENLPYVLSKQTKLDMILPEKPQL